MMKLLIIESHNGGRLANQLWNFISIYAYAVEKKYFLVNPTFAEYSGLFAQFKNNPLGSPNANFNFLPKNSGQLLLKVIKKLNKIIPIAHSVQTGEADGAIILPPTNPDFKPDKPVLLFNGWLFRNTTGLEKHRTEVMHKFRPAQEFQDQIDKFWQRLPEDSFKIAVHIRRTDYKQHLDGRYFFEIERYLKEMAVRSKAHPDKAICFVIFSDEPREMVEFKSVDSRHQVVISKNPAIVDLFLLSKCDEIIGPPSTFSQFASWYGQNRLNVIE